MHKKLLLHLLSDGKLHSGASLGHTLNMTRSAVWKLVQQLKKTTHLTIEAKTNQGYRIQEDIELLDLPQIKAYLNPRYHPYLDKTIILDSIPSTNTYLLERADNDEIYICLAEMQTAGRGRFNRPWVSPFGRNIYLSLRWNFLSDSTQLSGLSIAIAVSIIRALKKCGIQEKINIKWPNDLIWENRKLGGILIESQTEFHHHCHAIIGVGLNLYLSDMLKETLDFSCVDLTEVTKTKLQRNEMVGLLLEELLDTCAVFETQGLKPFIKEYNALDATFQKPVKITHQNLSIDGIGRGIDEKGYFLLEDEHNKIQRFICAEASLRVGN